MPDEPNWRQAFSEGRVSGLLQPAADMKKAGMARLFYSEISVTPYSTSTAAVSVSGRSTSSTSAIGALSPFRKPYFRMRR